MRQTRDYHVIEVALKTFMAFLVIADRNLVHYLGMTT